jgi:gamma-glutamyltranspeptidase/glutathione hydrolase
MPQSNPSFEPAHPMKPFNAGRAPVYARHWLACSSQPLAAAVGRDILRAGGNAVNAAVAMAAMVNLTEPMMNGLGGDCFALVRFGGEIFALNGSGRSRRNSSGLGGAARLHAVL